MNQLNDDYLSDEDAPELGRVSEARRAWLLRTDQELAVKLQDDEIVHHLVGNKYRNEQIREDFPTAAAVQAYDHDKIQEEKNKQKHIAKEDEKLAIELQKKILFERENKLKMARAKIVVNPRQYSMLKNGDLGPPPASSKMRQERIRLMNEEEYNISILRHSPDRASSSDYISTTELDDDVASGIDKNLEHEKELNAGVENYSEASTSHATSQVRSDDLSSIGETTRDIKELERALGIPRKILIEEKQRLLQVEKDAEIARLLSNSEDIIQTRDSEYARILQAREVEKYNKSKERQRLRHRQKYESESRRIEKNPNVVVSDTYCQPRDIIQASYNANEYGDGEGDSHYMEVLSADEMPANYPYDQNLSQDSYKNLRAPPLAPKLAGRPKLAEPGTSSEVQINTKFNQMDSQISTCQKTDKNSKKKAGNYRKEKAKNGKCSIQ